jgi:hypothetical protein
MNETELVTVERSLREIFAESGLQWILDQVDASIEAGISEQVQISFNRREPEFFRVPVTSGRKRPIDASTNRPYSAAERVDLLLTALERAATELPELHNTLIKTLAREGDNDQLPVQTVMFLPDEDATHASPPPPLEAVFAERSVAERRVMVRTVTELREVVGE